MAINRTGQVRKNLGSANRQLRQATDDRRWLAIPIVDRDPSEPGNGQAWAINVNGQLTLRVRIGSTTLSLAASAALGKVIFPTSYGSPAQAGEAVLIPHATGLSGRPASIELQSAVGTAYRLLMAPSFLEPVIMIPALAADPSSTLLLNDYASLWWNKTTNQLKCAHLGTVRVV